MSSPLNRDRQASLEKYFYIPQVIRDFDPRGASVLTSTDVRNPRTNKYYDIGTIWLNRVGQRRYYLESITNNLGRWVLTGGGTPIVITQTGDDGVAVSPDGFGNFDWTGQIVANATHAKPLFILSDGANGLLVDLQISTTSSSTNPLYNGVSHYSDDAFTIDADGFVQLIGGGQAAISFETDDGAPNVVPDGSGAIQVFGGTNVATSGQGPGNTITIDSSGFASFVCLEVTTDVNPIVPFTGYVANSAGAIDFTLPATSSFGDMFFIVRKGAGAVSILQNAGQTIHYNGTDTTTGATGSLDSNGQWDVIWIKTVTADTDFVVLNSSGSWTAN